ncbi:MAG: sugar phosphate isomerase/epimerase [Oscillospiraceae bacterium]|nr:sugar phosphate isomerase/epimerase [Oscillospiraceae bacterium]
MYKQKLGMNVNPKFGVPLTEQVQLLRRVGFEAFFSGWTAGDQQRELRSAAEGSGMLYRFIHAPFSGLRHLWQDDEQAGEIMDRLFACFDDCAEVRVPLVVMHAYIGFEPAQPTAAGVRYFEKLSDRAKQLGLQIALENTEGEAFLTAVMDDLKEEKHVGFCWDTGHELCYNHGQDMLGKYGDRLFCTHLNDNLGIRDFGGEITFFDDLHLLPFDGIADWQGVAARLDQCGYDDVLMFELLKTPREERREQAIYADMTPEAYFAAAYRAACRAASLRR